MSVMIKVHSMQLSLKLHEWYCWKKTTCTLRKWALWRAEHGGLADTATVRGLWHQPANSLGKTFWEGLVYLGISCGSTRSISGITELWDKNDFCGGRLWAPSCGNERRLKEVKSQGMVHTGALCTPRGYHHALYARWTEEKNTSRSLISLKPTFLLFCWTG